MLSNLTAIISYHDKNLVRSDYIHHFVSPLTDKIMLIDTKNMSNECKKIHQKYPHLDFQLDEFYSQSFYADEIDHKKKTDYVYHCHYRRFLELDDNIKLEPKTIYVFNDNIDYNHYTLIKEHVLNDKSENYNGMVFKIIDICASILGVNYDGVMKSIINSKLNHNKEMYVMHKDLQREMVHTIYKLIYAILDSGFAEQIIKNKRSIGFIIEVFVNLFIKVKKQEGYKVVGTCLHYYT